MYLPVLSLLLAFRSLSCWWPPQLWTGDSIYLCIPASFYSAILTVTAVSVAGGGIPSEPLVIHPQSVFAWTPLPKCLQGLDIPSPLPSRMAFLSRKLRSFLGDKYVARAVLTRFAAGQCSCPPLLPAPLPSSEALVVVPSSTELTFKLVCCSW